MILSWFFVLPRQFWTGTAQHQTEWQGTLNMQWSECTLVEWNTNDQTDACVGRPTVSWCLQNQTLHPSGGKIKSLSLYCETPTKAQCNEPLHCLLLLSPFLCIQGAVSSDRHRQSGEQRMKTSFNWFDQCKRGFSPPSEKDYQVAEV